MNEKIENTSGYDVEEYLNKELLRFTTAGSVDDGKSTLIGRLLFDSKAIFQDQMDQLEESSKLRGEETVNLALLTDGLRSEREQGITIDVAYRYFATPKRKFIIADTPGHEQYTRNMVTGASTADLAIILIDARQGVLTQSKRHGFIASLLGIPHVLVCVNKMDLVDFDRDIFDNIVREFTNFATKLDISDMIFIPISALDGDNVVDRSERTPWYKGPTVLHHLENVVISSDKNLIDFRFPVQYVVRPNLDFRGFSGRISSGTIKVGEEIVALPSRKTSRIKEIVTFDGNLDEASAGEGVTLTLEDEIDISRGEMIVRKNNLPRVENKFEATLCWMDDNKKLDTGTPYLIQHTSRIVQGYVRELRYLIDVNTLHRQQDAETLELNEIGRVVIETAMPLFLDPYKNNRETGSFVLIDPATNLTVAAGMVRYASPRTESNRDDLMFTGASMNIVKAAVSVKRELREERNGHKGHVLWLTGHVRSGKSTIARGVAQKLFDAGKQVFNIDGDIVRHGLCGDLGFNEKDRRESVRRIAQVAKMASNSGMIVICSLISPRQEMRDFARALLPEGTFSEIFVDCSVEECRKRDEDGLFTKADKGEIPNFTGVSAVYEVPKSPEFIVHTETESPEESIDAVVGYIQTKL
ncbi:MAG: sulfate adenylyltransferase subunit CysN [Deltaproteobacteria bacterium]|nr:sulfate adenylyltransferase subunit CysN [Deltaproteobacteria bacterium]MBN2673691.1 sulfate adenylyltransferase subunit CysN [Deltaproteobacteria bacterium]